MRGRPNEAFTLGGVAAVLKRIKASGDVAPKTRKRSKTERAKPAVAKIEKLAEEAPGASLQDLGRKAGLEKCAVRNVLKRDLKLKSLKKAKCHHLDGKKKQKRLHLATRLLAEFARGDLSWEPIFSTDEKMFRQVTGRARARRTRRYGWAPKRKRQTSARGNC